MDSKPIPDRNPPIPLESPYTPAYSAGSFVERYFDSGLPLPKELNRDSLVSSEVERIIGSLTIVIIAGSIPRRLGNEATDEELALDKKRAKRVGWALTQALAGWSKKEPKFDITPELEREGNQLEWIAFAPVHLTQLKADMRFVATWAVQHDEIRWGKSAIVNLENELRWFTYAMRD